MKRYRKIGVAAGILALLWTFLTLWVQFSDQSGVTTIAYPQGDKKALIIFNPDPIYDFDQQISRAFAEGINAKGYSPEIVTHDQAPQHFGSYDLLVFCANTYNWAPDWKITNLISAHPELSGKPCIAITLGAGSTKRAMRILEEHIQAQGGQVIGSKTYWLLRPNDESKMDKSNIEVAKDMARQFGQDIR